MIYFGNFVLENGLAKFFGIDCSRCHNSILKSAFFVYQVVQVDVEAVEFSVMRYRQVTTDVTFLPDSVCRSVACASLDGFQWRCG